jgi:hypothetical protein
MQSGEVIANFDRASLTNTTLYALDESNNPNSQLSFSGSWTTGTEAGLGMLPRSALGYS